MCYIVKKYVFQNLIHIFGGLESLQMVLNRSSVDFPTNYLYLSCKGNSVMFHQKTLRCKQANVKKCPNEPNVDFTEKGANEPAVADDN